MKLVRRIAFGAAFAMAVAAVEPASASVLALDLTSGGTVGTDERDLTLGWSFTVNSTITVDSLGLWDEGADGFLLSHLVRLWTSTGTLLASATVNDADTAVASANSAGQWYMESISPVILAPGNYVIGADGNGWLVDTFRFINQPISTISAITFGAGRALEGSTGFPTDIVPGNQYFGPTFGIEAAVPEPGSLLLLGLGLAGLALRRKSAV